MKKLTNKEAIVVIETEKKCVARANICDRDCAHCDLVLPEEDILLAYDMAIMALTDVVRIDPHHLATIANAYRNHLVDVSNVSSLDEEDDRK